MACSKKNIGFITVYNSFYGFAKETYPIEYFSNTQYLDFEDMKVPVPNGYVDILSSLYGNWKEFPDENHRYPGNLSELIYKENGVAK